ncbi:MAG: hypothetical protein KF729_15250 [Sandaracinaceae bacterium]|nr:hypothetical protein [Sandaracinaceae bacterium]
MARELDITPHTVKHHARRALERARLVRLSDFRDRIVRDHTVRDRLDDRLEPRASTDGATPVRVALDGDDLGIE